MLIRRSLLLVALLAGICGSQAAPLIDQVSASQKAQLTAGQTVVISQKVPGYAWPKLILFRVVNATPSMIYEMFGDYSAVSSYNHNVISAKVVAVNDDGSKDVEYTVKAPIIQRTSYTVRNTYTQKGNTYKVAWVLLNSPLAKSSDGSLKLEPYGKNQTLLRYENLCVPITTLFSSMQNQALEDAKSTVNDIAKEAQRRQAAAQ
jgi:hypothetical protein